MTKSGNIGGNLKRLRERAGLTQDELARLMGYSSSATISQWEANTRDIRASDMPKVAAAIHADIWELYGLVCPRCGWRGNGKSRR